MKKLYELAIRSIHREFYSVLGGGHNDSWEVAGEEYYVVRYKHLLLLSFQLKFGYVLATEAVRG